MRTGHLFAGAGGGLLADLIIGHKPVFAVEWEPYACQVLRERAADGWFPDLRVYEGDVRMFDPSEYTGSVDCIHAGFPCQDLSNAGRQAGLGEGTRSGLYREVLRIADVVRPLYLFLENVSAIVSLGGGGIGVVLADLSAMGYDSKWITLRASDVGAPHHRDRWWLLATLADSDKERCGGRGLHGDSFFGERKICSDEQNERNKVWCKASTCGHLQESSEVSNTSCTGLQRRTQAGSDGGNGSQCGHEQSAGCDGVSRRDGKVESSLGCVAYGLADRLDTHQSLPSWWEVEPQIGRVTTENNRRADQIKALGNGQVPMQAAVAWKLLGGE